MPLDPQRVQAIFLEAASQHDSTGRGAVLDRECNGDSELRQRIEALLRVHDRFNNFVNQPPFARDGRALPFDAANE
jgi:eukaryotic-like serine/threonine-protein kinase